MSLTADSTLAQTLGAIFAVEWSPEVSQLLFAPEGFGTGFTLADGFHLLDEQFEDSDSLIPLAVVDEGSLACVLLDDGPLGKSGDVVRVHLDDVPADKQMLLLDTDPLLYVHSVQDELTARDVGLKRILDEIGPAYEETYIEHEKRPRDFVVRPVRIACQNVIVALGAIAQDSTFDGLSVVAWQTCEVPHVATHEANRALAALTLSDAFQNGGTMEIRFDRKARVVVDGKSVEYEGHPEGRVPASLKRFGRTVGVPLGIDDSAGISPREARALFLAITPMPPDLRSRVNDAIDRRGMTPERLCFTLLSQIWREIELDFMLATSDRTPSILEGGADWRDRSSRQAEMDVARSSLMAGMLFRRLNGRDAAGAGDGPRVVEDVSVGVQWRILDELGAVEFTNLDPEAGMPWCRDDASVGTSLTVFLRSHVSEAVAALINSMHARGTEAAVAVPLDADVPPGLLDAPVLRCPDRAADLDKQAEARLLTSRISRG
jgi:hypothetical protein